MYLLVRFNIAQNFFYFVATINNFIKIPHLLSNIHPIPRFVQDLAFTQNKLFSIAKFYNRALDTLDIKNK